MNTLKQHVQAVHEGVKPAFKCQVCDYTCYRKAQLERHMFEHDGDPFKCDLCQFSTKYKATIINHMKTHGPKNLMCEFCEYATHSGLFKNKHIWKIRIWNIKLFLTSKRLVAKKSYYSTPYSSKRIQVRAMPLCWSFYRTTQSGFHLRISLLIGKFQWPIDTLKTILKETSRSS